MQIKKQKDARKMISVSILLVIGLVSIISPTLTQGQEAKFPSKAIDVVVPYAPGGIIDVGTRIFGEFLSRELKVPIVIKNVSGGGGMTGATAYLSSKPDGYTLLSSSGGAITSTVQLAKTPPFDPMKDFLPVGYIADAPIAMSVPKASPFKSFDDFLQFAKNNPGKLKGGVSSLGGETHIMFMSILKETKIDIKMIPYPGTGQLVTALLGEHVDWMTLTLPATLPYARSGDARVLLLTRPSPALPGVPSGREKGLPSVSFNIWVSFFALPQIPKVVYDRLVSAVEAVAKNPEVEKKLVDAGFQAQYKTPVELSNLIRDEWRMLSQIIKETGMKVD